MAQAHVEVLPNIGQQSVNTCTGVIYKLNVVLSVLKVWTNTTQAHVTRFKITAQNKLPKHPAYNTF